MAQLKVHNSLEHKEGNPPVLFTPKEEGKISWYACGPTVYDHSHLGHARNYVSTDIIRRILRDYHGFKINFVMNITDIDDKIILKARRKRLLELEKAKEHTKPEIQELATTAWKDYAEKNLPLLGELTTDNYVERRDAVYGKVLAGGSLTGEGKPGDAEAKMKMHLANMSAAFDAIRKEEGFGGADEVLLPYLDSLYKETIDGHDHTIFTEVTKYWEADFMQDMDALNVLRPDVITRVTAYVPQVVDFVNKLVEKGLAYSSDGSVYFDIDAFEKAGNEYARLRPDCKHDTALQEEGEGSESVNLGGKRGKRDFALWKKSKAGEPIWNSPWGEGRPGWHIECSVMASDILGDNMDIHSGGIDLAFPHHDNELALSEAYFCEHGKTHDWVNYFLHMGHLSIAGSKMSKSLKNFQTIQDALAKDYTARGMRIVFLKGKWNEGIQISEDMRTEARGWEDSVNKFFVNVKSLIQDASHANHEAAEASFSVDLEKSRKDMDDALVNSFDTPKAMRIIADTIKAANIHMGSAGPVVKDIAGLEATARWITKMVGIFGLDANASAPYDGIGWVNKTTSNSNKTTKEIVAPYSAIYDNTKIALKSLSLQSPILDEILSRETNAESLDSSDPEVLAMPYLRAISQIRDELRKEATKPTNAASKCDILELSDQIRDIDLAGLGVALDDRGNNQPALIKFVPAVEIFAQQEEKRQNEAAAREAKEKKRIELEKAEAERAQRDSVRPEDMFRDAEKYGSWDAEGFPLTTSDGKEVTKSAVKKLMKDRERQKKNHEAWKVKNA